VSDTRLPCFRPDEVCLYGLGSRATLNRTAEAAVSTWKLRYHKPVHSLTGSVLTHIRRHDLLKAGERIGVAVSGGIDSVALLRLLLKLRAELGIVLSVVHFNHQLRGAESDADEQFVAVLARQYDLELHRDSENVASHGQTSGIGLEAAARELRYGFFRYLLGEHGAQGLKSDLNESLSPEPEGHLFHGTAEAGPFPTSGADRSASPPPRLDKIVTGHTLDDQAETVLMRLIRGAGLKGLGGVHPRIIMGDGSGDTSGEIVRPLLAFRRRELVAYLTEIKQAWREDATNSDTAFTRNRVRKLLVPLLEKEFNPAVAENLAELAEIARGEQDYWENEVAGWMGTGVHWVEPDWAKSARAAETLVQISDGSSKNDARQQLRTKIENASWLVMNAAVDLLWLLGEPVGVQRRVIKAVGDHAGTRFEFKHVEEILRFAQEETGTGKELSLPLGWKVERHPHELRFVTPNLSDPGPAEDYEYDLPVPGRVDVRQAGLTIQVQRVPADRDAGYNPEHLLDGDSLPGLLKVRNWRAGDRFWPQHTKSPRKIKELLQERHVPQPERKLWPVVVSGDEVIWLRGFPPSARLTAKSGCNAVMILETSFGEPD
jgi:tRNA(Ile)-lysidine synthase